MEAVIGKERRECGSRVPGIVVRKICQGKEIGPICLLIVAINAQVLFKDRVQALRLAVRLWMECCLFVCTDAQEFDESSPKVGGEDRISVADEGFT